MGPCVGCGQPAGACGVCSSCRTEAEIDRRAREDAVMERQSAQWARERWQDAMAEAGQG